MIRVASWNATGPFAGMVVRHRPAPGLHRWCVVVKWKKPVDGGHETVEQTFHASEPCAIRVMHQIVVAAIEEELPDGAMVNTASLDFYIPSVARAGRNPKMVRPRARSA